MFSHNYTLLITFNLSQKFQSQFKVQNERKKIQIVSCKDFSLMYPNFTLSKILGIFPYRIKISSFEISKLRYILWTITVYVICVYKLTVLCKFNLSEKNKTDIPKFILVNFSIIYGIFLTVSTYILSGPSNVVTSDCIRYFFEIASAVI